MHIEIHCYILLVSFLISYQHIFLQAHKSSMYTEWNQCYNLYPATELCTGSTLPNLKAWGILRISLSQPVQNDSKNKRTKEKLQFCIHNPDSSFGANIKIVLRHTQLGWPYSLETLHLNQLNIYIYFSFCFLLFMRTHARKHTYRHTETYIYIMRKYSVISNVK